MNWFTQPLRGQPQYILDHMRFLGGLNMNAPRGPLLAASALIISSSPLWAWGSDGHRTVGMIADIILQNDPAGDAAHKLLKDTLSEAAVWADCAKGGVCGPLTPDEETYVEHNRQHKTYHYTDVPIQQPQYKPDTAGTRDNDVVQVTTQAINILRGRAPNSGPAVLDRKSALWVLAHMVGDLHQPLHVGAIYFDQECDEVVDPNVVGAGEPNFGIRSTVASTNGGNDLKLGNKSFHVSYWDDGTVVGAMRLAGVKKKSIQDFAQYIINHPPAGWQTSGDPATWPAQWATEIMPLANTALSGIEIGEGEQTGSQDRGPKCTWPVMLGKDYPGWANKQALNQLGKAGFRLAELLKRILTPQ
jgi:hypothetical protein